MRYQSLQYELDMSSQKEKKHEYVEKYGVVIFLDSLGTKGKWKSENPHIILENWENFLKIFRSVVKHGNNRIKGIKFYAFSDTIIITIPGKNMEKLLIDAGSLTGATVKIALTDDIYFRGAMSIGTFYESKNMILGPAVDEAAKYYEEGNWIGAIVAPSVYSALMRMGQKVSHIYEKYDVPTSNGKINTWCIKITNEFNSITVDRIKLNTVIDLVHKKLENLNDVDGIEKWKNLLDYMYHLESKKKNIK